MASRKEKSNQQPLEDLANSVESLGQFEADLNKQITQTRYWIRRAKKLDNPELLARWLDQEKSLLEQREHLEVIRGLVHQLL